MQCDTHQYLAQGLDPFGSKASVLDVGADVAIFNINSGTLMNFIQEYVSMTLSVVVKFLYL